VYIGKDDKVKTRVALEQSTLEFVSKLDGIDNRNIVCDTFQTFIEDLGFSNSACLRLPDKGERLWDCVLMNTRPDEWSTEYMANDHYLNDPMALELGRSYNPFAWSDVQHKRKFTKVQSEIMNFTADCGMDSGFVVPIFESNGNVALVSLAGENVEMSEDTRGAASLASIYLHNRLFTLQRMVQEDRVSLTPREVECLHWVAAGKSDWQIGQILNISAKTVNYHIENVKRKFGVATRIQAVVAAMRQGKLMV